MSPPPESKKYYDGTREEKDGKGNGTKVVQRQYEEVCRPSPPQYDPCDAQRRLQPLPGLRGLFRHRIYYPPPGPREPWDDDKPLDIRYYKNDYEKRHSRRQAISRNLSDITPLRQATLD
jgi:hypothetical protein